MELADSLSVAKLIAMSQSMYDGLVKAVVDVEKRIMMIDAPMHVDEEQALLEMGSLQQNLWGINLYPDDYGTDEFIEFDSMINIRPSQNNRSRDVEDQAMRKHIEEIVSEIIHD